MQTVELFCGKKSFSKVAASRGHQTFTVDFNPKFKPDLCIDIMNLTEQMLPGHVDFMWISRDCQTYSVGSGGKHFKTEPYAYRKYNLIPLTEAAKFNYKLVEHWLKIALSRRVKFFVVENPRGLLNHHPAMRLIPFKSTVYYADYGFTYMKPTDLWHNIITYMPKVPGPKKSYSHLRHMSNQVSADKKSIVPPGLIHELFDTVEPLI